MPNIKAVVEYDGTDFCGFQKQPSVRTIQGELERVLRELFRNPEVKIIGAGRTDAGVHATGQVVSFQAREGFPIDRIRPAVNGLLPKTIRVKDVREAPEDFHARYSAKARTYVYIVLNRETPTAILSRYTWRIMQTLDVGAMRAAVEMLIGTGDFASFGVPDKAGLSTVRQVFDFRISRRKDALYIKIRANAFLRGMVRAMVGTLIDVGMSKLTLADVAEILAARDRRAARTSAPPKGLFLTRVEY